MVKADFDESRGASHVTSEVHYALDPIKELRKVVTSEEDLKGVLLDVAVYGITQVLPDEKHDIIIRQGPCLNWATDKRVLQPVRSRAKQ